MDQLEDLALRGRGVHGRTLRKASDQLVEKLFRRDLQVEGIAAVLDERVEQLGEKAGSALLEPPRLDENASLCCDALLAMMASRRSSARRRKRAHRRASLTCSASMATCGCLELISRTTSIAASLGLCTACERYSLLLQLDEEHERSNAHVGLLARDEVGDLEVAREIRRAIHGIARSFCAASVSSPDSTPPRSSDAPIILPSCVGALSSSSKPRAAQSAQAPSCAPAAEEPLLPAPP